ncbi:mechanosensitive ion channel family protein [Sporosarcina sp. CAU 1771]
MTATTSKEKVSDFEEVIVKLEELVMNPETWINMGTGILKVLLIIVVAAVTIAIGKRIIRRVFSMKLKSSLRPTERREKTLVKLLENALSYIIYFAAIIAVLDVVGIKVAGILAGAGVLGLAVGFGAQSLVKDIISGFFIVFEDQFSVGDYVQIGTALGTVEEIGLRTTKISAYGGEIYIIPNGNISEVINYSINNSLAIVDIGIAYEADIVRAERLLKEFLTTLTEGYEELLAPPTLIGVQGLEASQVVFRVTAETQPVMQWAFARKFRKDVKVFLDANDIEIPYPKIVTYQGKEEG